MRTIGASKSSLFLMELTLAILFFAVSGAICLQMFAYASQTAQQAEELSYATLAARSGAECYQATEGDLNLVAELLEGTAQGDSVQVGYDQNWQTAEAEWAFELTLTQAGSVAQVVVNRVGEDTPIYTLAVAIAGGDSQ